MTGLREDSSVTVSILRLSNWVTRGNDHGPTGLSFLALHDLSTFVKGFLQGRRVCVCQ